ncbi:hypothetical protein BpHYR1_027451 [Brachionus plicatilis]|uniref:Uncharacterized protein n=1 Tax=Brachionus plicatilis TaxID=10195 RepID=A0A3M7Q7A5_BRAPC|nr:hypothetical protein BpHYR1_027451 [Brachionus plicatilis]
MKTFEAVWVMSTLLRKNCYSGDLTRGFGQILLKNQEFTKIIHPNPLSCSVCGEFMKNEKGLSLLKKSNFKINHIDQRRSTGKSGILKVEHQKN